MPEKDKPRYHLEYINFSRLQRKWEDKLWRKPKADIIIIANGPFSPKIYY